MLNKGPYIVKALCALDDILRRTEGHHRKSRSTLRKLRLAELFNLSSEASEAALAS
jgi:pyruvate kinase